MNERMRMLSISLAAVLAAAAHAIFAGETLPSEALATASASMARITSEAGAVKKLGAGVLVWKQGLKGLLATSPQCLPDASYRQQVLTVTFFGQGEKARDLVGHRIECAETSGLVLIEVEADDLPNPLSIANATPPDIGSSAFLVGPPSAAVPSKAGRPGAIALPAKIASIRQDALSRTALIQADLETNPLNTGGLLLDATGKVLGLCIQQIEDSHLSFSMPWSRVQNHLNGILTAPTFSVIDEKTYALLATVFDPRNEIAKATVHFSAKPQPQTAPGGDRPVQKMSAVTASVEIQMANGQARANIPAPEKPWSACFQFELTLYDGSSRFTQPTTLIPYLVRPQELAKPKKWLGTSRPKERNPVGEVHSTATGKNLARAPTPLLDATVTAFEIDPGQVADPVFLSADNKFLYVLEYGGIVRKISLPDFRETRAIDLQRVCTSMAPSAEGLAVAVVDLAEVWVLDADTLELKRRIKTALSVHLNSSWRISLAVGQPAGRMNAAIELIDLTGSTPARAKRCSDLALDYDKQAPLPSFLKNLAIYTTSAFCPDGTQYYMVGSSHLYRFQIKGMNLEYAEASPACANHVDAYRKIFFDSAGERVGVVVGKESLASDYPEFSVKLRFRPGFYLFEKNDISKPVQGLDAVGEWGVFAGAFNCARKEFYINGIVQFGEQGNRKKAYHLGLYSRQILVMPDGSGLFAVTEKGLQWLKLP